jgi:CheY-like chemotaxis protein
MDTPADVLIVDDDPDLMELVRMMLCGAGYTVRCARNGRDALEAVSQRMPAVVLLDMLMPVMDGWQCARELQIRHGRTVSIVVMTAAEHARARADQVGGIDAVLSKPFDMDDLLRVVARFVHPQGANGTVKLTSTTATLGIISTPKSSGRCHGVPRNERARAQKSLMAGAKPMSSNGEQVANDVVDREEPLGLCHRFKAPHIPLAPPGRLVGDFGPVVGVAGGVVDHRRHDDPVRGAVAPEAIGDEAVRDTAAPLEQLAKEPRGGVAIPAGLEQDVDDLAILVDSPPEILTLAANRHEEFVQMPRVADGPRPTPEPPRVGRTEDLAPVPDGLVRQRDAALGEEVFDVAEAEGEPVVEPDGVADHRGREPVAWIVRDRHPATVPAVASS